MAKNMKKISVTKFESILKDNTVTETLEGTEDVEIIAKRTLSLTEMADFVQDVVSSCVDAESGEYVPEAYDFALRVAILTRYANFTMPANMDKQYILVYDTPAVNQVLNMINLQQFNEITNIIDKKIDFILSIMVSSAASKVRDVIDKFGEIADVSKTAFGNINPEEMSKVMQELAKLEDATDEDIAMTLLNSSTDKKSNEVIVTKG